MILAFLLTVNIGIATATLQKCFEENKVSLIVEGYPSAANSDLIQTCSDNKIPVAFFVPPTTLNQEHERVSIKKAIAAGYTIGYRTNPTMDEKVQGTSSEDLVKTIKDTAAVFEKEFGRKLLYVMLPFNNKDYSEHIKQLHHAGFIVVGRNVDYNRKEIPKNILSVVKEQIAGPASNSFIVLVSAYKSFTGQLVKTIAQVAKEHKFAVVPLSQCLSYEVALQRKIIFDAKSKGALAAAGGDKKVEAGPPPNTVPKKEDDKKDPATLQQPAVKVPEAKTGNEKQPEGGDKDPKASLPLPDKVPATDPPKTTPPADSTGGWNPLWFFFIGAIVIGIIATGCYCFATANSEDTL